MDGRDVLLQMRDLRGARNGKHDGAALENPVCPLIFISSASDGGPGFKFVTVDWKDELRANQVPARCGAAPRPSAYRSDRDR